MLREFKAFIMRGNLIDLAVAFVLGVAFASLVTAFTNAIVSPLIGLVVGEASLSSLSFSIGKATFFYGAFLDAVINFILVALVLFLVVKTYNRFRAQGDATVKTCEFCRSVIPVDAVRCPDCTSDLRAA